jgi:hypothetical protein
MLLADVELSTKLTALGAVEGKGRKEVVMMKHVVGFKVVGVLG